MGDTKESLLKDEESNNHCFPFKPVKLFQNVENAFRQLAVGVKHQIRSQQVSVLTPF